jgi:hypothetical protein
MIRLLPNTDIQTIQIICREFPTVPVPFNTVNLVITEDGTGVIETIQNIEATIPDKNSNFVYLDIAFSILKENNSYYLEFSKGSDLLYRDKAYATSQLDKEVVHTINEDKYDEYSGSGNEEYIVL